MYTTTELLSLLLLLFWWPSISRLYSLCRLRMKRFYIPKGFTSSYVYKTNKSYKNIVNWFFFLNAFLNDLKIQLYHYYTIELFHSKPVYFLCFIVWFFVVMSINVKTNYYIIYHMRCVGVRNNHPRHRDVEWRSGQL